MRLPDFEAWAIFAKVVETGSFAATAIALNLSQSTVSKAISRLEEKMKTTFFHRTSRKLTLTESGLAVQKQAQQLLHAGFALEAQLQEIVNQHQGNIRFTVPTSFGLQQVAPLLPEFCAQYPDIELDMHLSDTHLDLIDAGFDFALRIANLEDSSLRAKRLCDVRLLLVGAPTYFAQHGTLVHPTELAQHLAFLYTNVKHGQSWKFSHPLQGEVTQTIQGKIKANNSDVFFPALLAGQGLAVMPEFMVCEQLKTGQLLTALNDWQISPLALYLLSPPNPLRPKRVQILMDFLSEKLTKMA